MKHNKPETNHNVSKPSEATKSRELETGLHHFVEIRFCNKVFVLFFFLLFFFFKQTM